MTRVSRVFAGCTRPYFEAMETVLAPQREQLAAQHRALLERFAAELTAAGYFP
jgi:hypothetical protein